MSGVLSLGILVCQCPNVSLSFIIIILQCKMRKDLVVERRLQIYLLQVTAYVAYSDETKEEGQSAEGRDGSRANVEMK